MSSLYILVMSSDKSISLEWDWKQVNENFTQKKKKKKKIDHTHSVEAFNLTYILQFIILII